MRSTALTARVSGVGGRGGGREVEGSRARSRRAQDRGRSRDADVSDLWIDPWTTESKLKAAVLALADLGMTDSIYNHSSARSASE